MNDRSPPASAADGMTLIEHLPFDIDEGIASRARIGLMVLATDFTIVHEWRAIMTGLKGVALYESRILNDAQITPETPGRTAIVRHGNNCGDIAAVRLEPAQQRGEAGSASN